MPKTIPMTPMTDRYFRIRRLSQNERLDEAEDHLADSAELVSEVNESTSLFAEYANSHPFYPRPRSRYSGAKGVGKTRELAALLESAPERISHVAEDPTVSFRYVDREIKFARTASSAYYASPGKPATDNTAIRTDLLLRMTGSGAPTVGEIKIGTDTDPYEGLIQALACACELATPNQLERLSDQYPEEQFAANVRVTVLIVLANLPARENSTYWHDLHEIALKLSSAINDQANALGRIAIVEVSPDGRVRPSSPVAR